MRELKREFLQLAHVYDRMKHSIGGWMLSEKLNWQRCFWDGGVSRGLPKTAVPWANTDKDERHIASQCATGLWSRYGNVIHAPDWWLDRMPLCPLDGELGVGVGEEGRQRSRSITSKLEPVDGEWEGVRLAAFDLPPLETVFRDGLLDNVNYKKRFYGIGMWLAAREYRFLESGVTGRTPFKSRYIVLDRVCASVGDRPMSCYRHTQTELPFKTELAEARVEALLKAVVARRGEGLILRDPFGVYECCRTHQIVKVKPWNDAEGVIVGYTSGRKTDRGSRLLGKIGALILRIPSGARLEVSGLDDCERELDGLGGEWALQNPGKDCPDWVEAKRFRRGETVTYKYTDTTRDGLPVSASFIKKWEVE